MYLCENCGQAYIRRPTHCVKCHSNNIVFEKRPKPAVSKKGAIIGSVFGILSFFISIILSLMMISLIAGTNIQIALAIFCAILLPFTFTGLILTVFSKPCKGFRLTGLIFSILSLIPWAIIVYLVLLPRLAG